MPGISHKLSHLAFSSDNFPYMQVCQKLMKESVDLLKSKKLNRLILGYPKKDCIELFFEFQSGALVLWTDIYTQSKDMDSSIIEATARMKKKQELIVEIYNSEKSKA